MTCSIHRCHDRQQFDHLPLETTGLMTLWLSKSDFSAPKSAATLAFELRDIHFDEDRFRPIGAFLRSGITLDIPFAISVFFCH